MTTPVIFLAFANDADAHLDLLKEESKEIWWALNDLDRKEHIKVHREESADIDEIFDAFTLFKDRVAIFHYGGHAGGTHLRLEGGVAHAAGLAGLMGEQSTLKLVFLNGCATEGRVDTLMAAGVRAVIATSVPIEDRKAQEFAVRFYRALAERRTIRQAFRMAEAFLETKYGDRTEAGIVSLRDVHPVAAKDQEAGGDAIPWGLYVKEEHQTEILEWKLPYYRSVGLPQDVREYIHRSFTANRHIVGVLDEMTRYNPDIYAQMMEQRGGELVRKDSKYFPELIIKNFPWPVGSQIRLLRLHDRPDLQRLSQLVSTYVRTGQILYYILLSDVWEARRRRSIRLTEGFDSGQPLDAQSFSRFDFLARAIDLFALFEEQAVGPYVAEFELLAEAWQDENGPLRKAHGFLEDLRDRLRDEPPTADIERLSDRAEQAVAVVLRAAAFLAGYRMLTVRNILLQAPRFEPIAYEVDLGPLNAAVGIDLNLYQDAAHRKKDAYANSHSVVLVRNEDRLDDCLNLSPFLIDKNTFVRVKPGETTETDKLAHVFVIAFEEDDRVVYLAVDRSIDVALANEADRIHTQMTQADFTEGRNLLRDPGGLDEFGLDAGLGLDDTTAVDDSPRVFALLQDQYEALKVDLTSTVP